jgi:hypothetical protein
MTRSEGNATRQFFCFQQHVDPSTTKNAARNRKRDELDMKIVCNVLVSSFGRVNSARRTLEAGTLIVRLAHLNLLVVNEDTLVEDVLHDLLHDEGSILMYLTRFDSHGLE